MNKIDAILNFIDNPTPQETPERSETPKETPEQSETPQETPQQESIQGTPEQSETTDFNIKEYNRVMRQIKKTSEYPAVLKIGGKNIIVNSSDELQQIKEQQQKIRKEQTAKERRERIEKTKMTFEDDGYIYKKPSTVYAIKKDGERLKVPTTSHKDSQRIYKTVSKDKDKLKKMVKAQDKEEFNELTAEAIEEQDEEFKNMVHNHTNNNINTDRTWDKQTLIKMLLQEMKTQGLTIADKQGEKRTAAQTFGFNPLLLKK